MLTSVVIFTIISINHDRFFVHVLIFGLHENLLVVLKSIIVLIITITLTLTIMIMIMIMIMIDFASLVYSLRECFPVAVFSRIWGSF